MHLRSWRPAKSTRRIYPGAFLLITLLAPAFSTAAQAQDRAADRWDRCAALGPDFAPVESSDNCARLSGHVRVQFGANSGWAGNHGNEAGRARLPSGPAQANLSAAPRSIETPAPQERVLLRPRAFGGL